MRATGSRLLHHRKWRLLQYGVENGTVDDQPRLDYISDHLAVTAISLQGLSDAGLFAWSLMDNFEWAEGYRMRFGIVHVDYETQVRTIKKAVAGIRIWRNGFRGATTSRDDAGAGGRRFCTKRVDFCVALWGSGKRTCKRRARAP